MPFTQYTSLDFENIKAQIKDFLRSNSNFKDFDFESVDHDLACVEKMGNLETLQLEISWNWGDAFYGSPVGVDETRLILPLLKKLNQFCSKIHSLVLNLRNFPGGM